MTIDEAIAHAMEVAERQEISADDKEMYSEMLGEDYKGFEEGCQECATEHRQLAEWLTELKDLRELNDKIYDVLAKQFGSPCNCSYAVDEYMRKKGGCDDCGIEIPDKECWSRYIQTKLVGDE